VGGLVGRANGTHPAQCPARPFGAAGRHAARRSPADDRSEIPQKVASSLQNETVRNFLEKEFERFTFGYRADGIAPIQNKIGAFLADPLLNRILTKPEKDLHVRRVMDESGVILVNLAKGRLGDDSSSLLGDCW